MSSDLVSACGAVLFYEAACLDQRRWADWLALYADDAEYWIPAWTDTGRQTADPQTELSLIYYRDKAGLEDRIWRIESGLSPASQPMPRTCHLITNIRLENTDVEQPRVGAHWQVNVYRPEKRQSSAYYGSYEHVLRRNPDAAGAPVPYLIAKKKITLLNDDVESALDVYHV